MCTGRQLADLTARDGGDYPGCVTSNPFGKRAQRSCFVTPPCEQHRNKIARETCSWNGEQLKTLKPLDTPTARQLWSWLNPMKSTSLSSFFSSPLTSIPPLDMKNVGSVYRLRGSIETKLTFELKADANGPF